MSYVDIKKLKVTTDSLSIYSEHKVMLGVPKFTEESPKFSWGCQNFMTPVLTLLLWRLHTPVNVSLCCFCGTLHISHNAHAVLWLLATTWPMHMPCHDMTVHYRSIAIIKCTCNTVRMYINYRTLTCVCLWCVLYSIWISRGILEWLCTSLIYQGQYCRFRAYHLVL